MNAQWKDSRKLLWDVILQAVGPSKTQDQKKWNQKYNPIEITHDLCGEEELSLPLRTLWDLDTVWTGLGEEMRAGTHEAKSTGKVEWEKVQIQLGVGIKEEFTHQECRGEELRQSRK